MNPYPTQITNSLVDDLTIAVGDMPADQIFILTDDNSLKFCFNSLSDCVALKNAHLITVKSGDENKNIDAAVSVWKYLSENGANRKSLLINLGGGMITDLGGFVASTFKRGIRYINVSTTLLGAVDAATGGKTGINFMGLKNEIGVFNPAERVLIYTPFFKTLDDENIRSGYAEMVKHALIDKVEEWLELMNFDLAKIDFFKLSNLVDRSVKIKERVVEIDPRELGLRKALNLGHTIGHAFESFSYRVNRPVLHGYAVVWGLWCELYLSHLKLGFPMKHIDELTELISRYYGWFNYSEDDFAELYEWMTHDKKNDSGFVNFTLLSAIGEIQINQTATKDEIVEVLSVMKLKAN